MPNPLEYKRKLIYQQVGKSDYPKKRHIKYKKYVGFLKFYIDLS
jgi:hypothetical protein